MSSIVDASFSRMELLSGDTNITSCRDKSLNRKRWHVAFATIYSSRAFLHPFKHQQFVKIDNSILTNLVKQRSLDELANLGGVDGVTTSLGTDQQRGISGDEEDIVSRHESYGRNSYTKAPSLKRFFHFVWEAVKDPTNVVLLACAALSLGFEIKESNEEGASGGGIIFFAAFVGIFVSAVSDFRNSVQADSLSKIRNDVLIEVVRNGRRQQVSVYEVVVGDVVCLKIGDQVPADGLFIDGETLQVDESSLTGESDLVGVDRDENPFLVSGTKVADGYAKMVVTCVGMNTLWGETMSAMSLDCDEQTPLQTRLAELTSSIRKVGLTVAFVVLVVLVVLYFTGNTKDVDGNTELRGKETKTSDVINAVVVIITTAATIVVVAIPEGLPLVVTLTLAYSLKRMMADQAVVRKLSAFEMMSSATTICTNKTGTLTLNKMKVTKLWQGNVSMEERGYATIASNIRELFHQGAGLNTMGGVCKSSVEGSSIEFSGSPIEKAILTWAVQKMEMDMEAVERGCNVVLMEGFSSERKRSGILMKKAEDGSSHVHWKGAAEVILAMCSHYYDLEGKVKALGDNERMEIDRIMQGMAASSLQCIAFAHKQVNSDREIQEDGLMLMGFVGLKDPCRPGVKEAVEDCRNAGLDVKMITGDNAFTAKAIATDCGILQPDDSDEAVVQGVEFRNYTEEERMARVDEIRVMPRSSPFDKLLMVECLKKKGHVVAVMGDGTNDAPVLKEADIGLSMGIQGTEVAKERFDILILDDNFTSLVTALKWGRCVCNNIHKFIQFQLTANIAALLINFIAAVSGADVPLTIIQLLWMNMVIDTLGALALAMDKPGEELLEKRFVVEGSEPLISNVMWRDLLAQALYQMSIHLVLAFKGESMLNIGETENNTLIFNIFVMCQIFNLFNARKVEKKNVFEGIEKNRLFMGIIGITVVLQVVIVEFMNKFADLVRLNLWEWGMCIGMAATSWPIALAVKFIPVPERPFFSYLPCSSAENVELETVVEFGEIIEAASETELLTRGPSSEVVV